ncbi:NADPH:quinone reductase [Micromonospora rhizosphaerae]|uniref:NADPH:quinone reductase n=1 Tax=Micromonospora rhizosphaerae TaxID=568872 RepID=A0A1C6SCE4_9ACTN|nr:zinc-binding dehydrogenase [Micromonospora rhizosphaerae]SCL27012.1 NADPH:quinone reductase [Micromonospora rhizosphaerae]
MRAALLKQLGRPPVVANIPIPTPKPGQALVRVTAAPLNPLDLLIASGHFYAGPPAIPYVPGAEGVGYVVQATSLTTGTRVRFETHAGYSGTGSLAEYVGVEESATLPIEEDLPDADAAALGVSALAGWVSLQWRAQLMPGERVLVLGATGAVGQIAIQAARLLGAGHVVAAARPGETLEALKDLGADAIVPLDSQDPVFLEAAFREAAGGPVDVTIDPLWGPPALAAIRATATMGRVVNLGQSAASEVPVSSAAVRGRMVAVLGYSNLVAPAHVLAAAYKKIIHHARRGDLRMHLSTFTLGDVAEAWVEQKASPHRKLVVVL